MENIEMRIENDETPKNGNSSLENDDNINDLHLSQVQIMKWSVPKPMDSATMEKVKQVCHALDGDEIYHYENIDDFDDTTKESQRVLRRGKSKYIHCRFFIDENGVCTPSPQCGGRSRRRRFDLEWYIVGEIARGCDTVRCCNNGCSNIYDPWDIVCLLGTKDIHLWYETVAFDPVKGKKKTENKKQVMKVSTKVAPENDESTPKKSQAVEREVSGDKQTKSNWWRKKKRSTKQPKDSSFKSEWNGVSEEFIRLYHPSDEDGDHKQYKYECETCLLGFDVDPRKETAKCDHYTCSDCLKKYFENQVNSLITKIECPRPDCHEMYENKFIKNMLSSNHRVTYSRLYYLRLELEKNDKDEVKRLERVCQRGPNCTEDKCMCTHLESPEWWIEKSRRFAYCPACGTLVEKMNDGGCNNVKCGACKFSFCWVCKKGADEIHHAMHCSLFGNKKYSKKRVLLNYVACGTGVVTGAPIAAVIVIGGGLSFFGSVIAAGVLSPPYYLSKTAYKYHKKRNSSKTKRMLATIGAAGLGVIGMPVLSLWGMWKTMKTACISTVDTLLDLFEEGEPEKELPDDYNENRKKGTKISTPEDALSTKPDSVTTTSNALQHGQELSQDKDQHKQSQQALEDNGNRVDESTELSRKRKYSAISRNQHGEASLNALTKETAA